MKWLWLLASLLCAFTTAVFLWVIVVYFMYDTPTWRIVAMFSVVAFWSMLTRDAWLKFVRTAFQHGNRR